MQVILRKTLEQKIPEKIYMPSTAKHDASKSSAQSLQCLCKSSYSLIHRNIYDDVQYHHSEQWIKWLLQGFLLSINYKWHHQWSGGLYPNAGYEGDLTRKQYQTETSRRTLPDVFSRQSDVHFARRAPRRRNKHASSQRFSEFFCF